MICLDVSPLMEADATTHGSLSGNEINLLLSGSFYTVKLVDVITNGAWISLSVTLSNSPLRGFEWICEMCCPGYSK